MKTIEKLKTTGKGTFKIERLDGSIETIPFHNLTTNAGKAAFTGLMGNIGSVPAFGWLALGTSTTAPSATQTALVAEITTNGLARVAATVTRTTTLTTNDTLTFTYQWTATGSQTVNEVGYFNAATAGTMGGRAVTDTTKSLVSGEKLTGTYNVILS